MDELAILIDRLAVTEADGYAAAIAAVIENFDTTDKTYFYIEAFTVAHFGEPVSTYHWNGHEYEKENA